jgi:hypothetical protein
MKTSLARYFFAKLFVPALVINAVVAGLLSLGVSRAGREVPLDGPLGAREGTMVASFAVGFLTLLVVAPFARLEARAGRVRGLGVEGGWLAWSAVNVVVSATLLGAAWLLLSFPATSALESRWPAAMPRNAFVLFEAAFAGVCGVLAAFVAALRGISAEKVVEGDPRWCRSTAPPAYLTYPCDYMDKSSLAIANRERGSTATPMWDLRVRGAVDPEHVKRALADAAIRYPSITTKIQSLDGVPPAAREYRFAQDPSFRVESIFDVVTVRNAEEEEAVARERRSRHLDLFTEFPVTLTMVITGEDTSRFLFRQHHAIADGRAFMAFLADFSAFLNDARAGRRPAPEALVPIGRRGELEPLGLTPRKQALQTLAGFGLLLRARLRAVFDPLVPLLQNRSNDYTGENGTIHWLEDDKILGPWNAARKRFDVSLNTLLTGAFMLANQRIHRRKGLPVGRTNAQLLMETRPRAKSPATAFVSFANHLTFLEAEADLDARSDPAALLTSIQKQVVGQMKRGEPIKRLLGERWFILRLPLEDIQKVIFDTSRPSSSLNFSNMIALELPHLGGDGWRVEELMGTTPVAPRHGVALVALRYGGKVVFNFNYKSSAATREFALELCEEFQRVMSELSGPVPAPAPGGAQA